MGLPYVPPGVTITEATTPQVVPLLTSAAEVVLIGFTAGHAIRTDQVVMTGTATIKLPFLEAIPGSVLTKIKSVYNASEPSAGENEGKGYKVTRDWVEEKVENGIKREGAGKIASGTICNVEYEYVPADYFNPVRLYNANEVQTRFGPAFEGENIGESALSVAALKAFENGARALICQPLFYTTSGKVEYSTQGYIKNATQVEKTKTESETGSWANVKSWEVTLEALNTVENIDLLVPVLGCAQANVTDVAVKAVIKSVLSYEINRNAEEQYIVSIFAGDSTNGVNGAKATLEEYSNECREYSNKQLSQQNVVLNTGNFGMQVPASASKIVSVGGQYMAAAVAGALAARPASSSLTRKAILGFVSVKDLRTPAQKNKDAEQGLMVIEQVRGEIIRCRHALTTDNSQGAARSELSVVRAKFNLIESIRETLENQVVGQIIADGNSPIIVRSAISAVLTTLVSTQQIVAYEAPIVALATTEPTTITASFSYRPAFTLNYINVNFSLNLSNQTVTTVETTQS